MAYFSLVDTAHHILAEVIQDGDMAIDATVGNGHDVVFLAKAVGRTGRVLGFDIQADAIENTRVRLQRENVHHRVELFMQSHAHLEDCIPDNMARRIKVVMFNLGYLPGGDKSVITRRQSTLHALNTVLPHLVPGGVISIVAYRGHNGGQDESRAVSEWSSRLDKVVYSVQHIHPPATSDKAPLLFIVKRQN
ncbi:class I SAM-dependent methyltransferase [Kaarinaea lacus]